MVEFRDLVDLLVRELLWCVQERMLYCEKHLADLTDRVICEAIHADVSEAAEGAPKGLPEPEPEP